MPVDPNKPLAEYERECIQPDCNYQGDKGPAVSDAECPSCGGKLYITTWTGDYV